MDDVPSCEGRAKALNFDPPGRSRKILWQGTGRKGRGVWRRLTANGRRQAIEESGQRPAAWVIPNISRGLIAVDLHRGDFAQAENAAEKNDARVTKVLSEEIFIAQPDHIIEPGDIDLCG